MPQAADSVLLMAFGGPTRPEEIRPFLDHVLSGRPIPEKRYEEVVQHYVEVGGASPLCRLTEQQAGLLRAELHRDGPDLPVFVGMRHWHPFIADTLAAMTGKGKRHAIGLILAAHPSPASREAYLEEVAEGRRKVGPSAPEVSFADPFYDHPLFIEALADRLRSALDEIPAGRRGEAAILFTAHSIPSAMSERSGYEAALKQTAELLAARAGIDRFRLVFQSRSGQPTEPWLEPDVNDALREMRRNGVADAVVAPIGFVSDHVEVLYDLDIQAKSVASQEGIGFHRAGTVGDHPAFARLLADRVRSAVRRVGGS